MNSKKIALAAAAASLFLAGSALAEGEASGSDAKVKCEGVNACKGKSACATAGSACAGKNACKGKGFVMMTEEECEDAKADTEQG